MQFLAVIVLVALALPALSRGSYARLAEARWRGLPLLVGGIGAQAALEWVHAGDGRAEGLAYGLLVASYVLLLAWAGTNLLKRGMAVVALGIALNALVVTVNRGMPVDVPGAWEATVEVTATAKHHPYDPSDRLRVLSDIVPVPGLSTIVSFGDLILAVGLLDVVFHASRRARTRPSTTEPTRLEAVGGGPASADQVIDLTEDELGLGTEAGLGSGADDGLARDRGRPRQHRDSSGQPIEHV